MDNRGDINNRARAAQIKSYSGLRWGNITPTDIDGFIDFSNQLFIIIELKLCGIDVPYGQRLALERICTACSKGGVKSIVLVATHQTEPNEDINAESCLLSEFFVGSSWKIPKNGITLRQAIDKLRKLYLP